MNRHAGAFMLAVVVLVFAIHAGIPVWRDWVPGDASDLTLFTFIGLLMLTRPKTA